MALSYGFYNSIDGDRTYDAVQLGQIFDGIITDGIYATYGKAMAVIASENAGEVIIQPGRAWFNHTWSYNDANFVMAALAPDVLLDRIDALVLDVNTELATRANSFVWVPGTAASNPTKPTLINTLTHHQYPLCYVHRYPETTMIYARDITNTIGTSECPFVTGVLEGMDIDDWMRQWDDEFHAWENSTKEDFDTWQSTVVTNFLSWQSEQKSAFEAWENQQIDAYSVWFAAVEAQQRMDKASWDAWYASTVESLHNLPEDTAEYLQVEIDELKQSGLSGSYIKVTTTSPSLEGMTVSITSSDGQEVKSGRFDENLSCQFNGFKSVGNVTITSTDGLQTATKVVNLPYFSNYEFAIAFWGATVNIEADEELAGLPVSVKDSNGTTVGTVTLDLSGHGAFGATKPDTYSFSVSYEGDTITESVAVLQEETYNVSLSVFKATVNVVGSPVSQMAYKQVRVTNSINGNVENITLDSNATATYIAKKQATYTFSADY